MSSKQTPERAFQQVAADMDFDTFDMFTDSAYFDDYNPPSADVPLPSVECGHDLSSNFFDSAYDVDFDVEGLHADMSVWPAGDLLRSTKDLPTGPVEITSSRPQVTEILPVPVLSPSSGSIEALWRPLMGSKPVKVSLPVPPAPSRAPVKPRAPKPKPAVSTKAAPKAKVSKVAKTKKPAKVHKRTVSAPSSAPRDVQVLYNLPWSHLFQEEKGLLLLPLLQGIDPTTDRKMGEAGSLLPPPEFEMIREDVFGTGDDGANLMEKQSPPKTSSPAATTTRDIDAEDAAVFRACNEFNKKHDMMRKQSALSDFNFDIPDFHFEEPNWDVFDNFMPAGQGLDGPYGNGVIGNPVEKPASSNISGMIGGDFGQMPTPSGDYGRKRQQEALKRNAILRAAGRRR